MAELPAHLPGIPRSSGAELPPEGDLELLSWIFAPSHLPEAPDRFAILRTALRDISFLVMASEMRRASLWCCVCV